MRIKLLTDDYIFPINTIVEVYKCQWGFLTVKENYLDFSEWIKENF